MVTFTYANFFFQKFQFETGNVFAGSATFQARFEDAYKRFFDEINKRGKSHKQYRERYK